MIAVQVLRWLILAAQVWIAAPVLYLCLISCSAMVATSKRTARKVSAASRLSMQSTAPYSFAVLVPAHDEEVMLGRLLQALEQLTYPKDRYTVYVVADNCADRTAELAQAAGWIQVYERSDPTRRGKGYALNWILERLEADGHRHDAYMILDADSRVPPDFLTVMAMELATGAQAMQARYTILNPTDSAGTLLRWIAFALMVDVRQLGRYHLGGSSTLLGNGMCFSRELLQRHPWRAFALSEDYQYYLTLVAQGERVRYVPDAVVRGHMPMTFAQMRTQDVRWESGRPDQPAWKTALQLLWSGLCRRDFVRLDALAELLVPPLSVIVYACLLTSIGSLALSLIWWSPLDLLPSLILWGGLLCYVGAGFYLLRPPFAAYRAVLYAPGFMAWKLWVHFVLRRSKRHTAQWVRTSRPASAKQSTKL